MSIRNRKKIKLKTFLVLFTITVNLVLLSVLGIVMLDKVYNQIDEKVDLINHTKLYQVSSKLDGTLESIENLISYLKDNRQLLDYIRSIEDDDNASSVKLSSARELDVFLINMSSFSTAIESINILTANSLYCSTGISTFKYPVPAEISSRRVDDIVFIDKTADDYELIRDEENNSSISVLKDRDYFTTSLVDGDAVIGRIYIIMSGNFMDDILGMEEYTIINGYNDTVRNKSSLTADDIDQIAASTGSSNIYSENGTNVYRQNMGFKNWMALYIPDMRYINTNKQTLTRLMLLTFLACIIITVASSEIISRRIISPVRRLTELMRRYRKTELARDCSIKEKPPLLSLKTKMFLFFAATIFIPVIIFITVLYSESTNTVEAYVKDSYYAIFKKNLEGLNEFVNARKTALKRIAYDSYVESMLQSPDDAAKAMVKDIFYSQSFLGLDRDWIGVYNQEGELIVSNGNSYLGDDVVAEFRHKIEFLKSGIYWNVVDDRLGHRIINMGMCVEDILNPGRSGVSHVRIEIDSRSFFEKYMDMQMSGCKLYIKDESGREIARLNSEDAIDSVIDAAGQIISVEKEEGFINEDHLVFIKKLDDFNWYFVSAYEYGDIDNEKSMIVESNKFVIILIFLLVMLLSFLVASGIVKPVKTLSGIFKNINLHNINEGMRDKIYIDEISELGSTFNTMLDRIESLIDDVITVNAQKNKAEGEKKDAEIIALQAQINPHFLYNTLDTVRYMIKSGLSEKAVSMVESLSDLFRYGISRGELLIGIKEEIEYARAYSDIMSFRYGDRLKFIWNIDESAYSYKIIKLILQPIIENSINHGIKDNIDEGVISIACACLPQSIRFVIKDNGMGIDSAQLQEIRSNLKNKSSGGRIGIYNVQTRLNLYYGESGTLTINSVKGKGTEVVIEIPKNEEV